MDDDNEALELLETTNDTWLTAFWVIKYDLFFNMLKKELLN